MISLMQLTQEKVVIGEARLPVTITFDNGSPAQFVEWYFMNKDYVEDTITQVGAVHVQGVGIDSVEKFGELMKKIRPGSPDFLDANSTRSKFSSNVYNASEYDENSVVRLHTEFSYSKIWPDQIHFCCVQPALEGGQTTVAKTSLVSEQLDKAIIDEFHKKGIIYIRNLHGGQGFGPSWMEAFGTDDKNVLEEYCRNNDIITEWLSDTSLRVRQSRPALRNHPKTGELLWFNQVDQFYPEIYDGEIYQTLLMMADDDEFRLPMYSTYGDGSKIQKDYIEAIVEILDEIAVPVPWKKGDILIVDNMAALHGRLPFSGDRKILASMSTY